MINLKKDILLTLLWYFKQRPSVADRMKPWVVKEGLIVLLVWVAWTSAPIPDADFRTSSWSHRKIGKKHTFLPACKTKLDGFCHDDGELASQGSSVCAEYRTVTASSELEFQD